MWSTDTSCWKPRQVILSPLWPKATTSCLRPGPIHNLLLVQPPKILEHPYQRCGQDGITACLNVGIKVKLITRQLLGKQEKRNTMVHSGQGEDIQNYQRFCWAFLSFLITTYLFFSFTDRIKQNRVCNSFSHAKAATQELSHEICC